MERTLEQEVRRIAASMESEEPNEKEHETPGTTEQETEPAETIHIHYYPDAIVIVKEDGETAQECTTVETTLVQPKQPTLFIGYAMGIFYLFLIFSTLAFQVYEILNPPIAKVTIVPRSQTVTLIGTLQLGRLLHPLTISQSQTTPTTGKGHQDAKHATGYITFYNGQLTSVTVAAGTVLAGSDGVQIVTDQDAYIPAESQTIPPTIGQTTVSAHALVPGTRGNILSGDINQGCCAPSVLAQNTASFHGGLNEREYQTVTKEDINGVATTLKTTLAQSMQGALQGQVQPPEQLFILPCTPRQTSDHRIGEEATIVTITVSQTCGAVAYNNLALGKKGTDLLTHQAIQKLGTGYSLFGAVNVRVTQATILNRELNQAILSFHAHGIWVYALSKEAQEHIKSLIAGKTKQEALQVLLSLSGIETASIEGDDTPTLPKNPNSIHFSIIIRSS